MTIVRQRRNTEGAVAVKEHVPQDGENELGHEDILQQRATNALEALLQHV